MAFLIGPLHIFRRREAGERHARARITRRAIRDAQKNNSKTRKMSIDLYHIVGSPPCSAVSLTANILGVKLNCKNVDLAKGEQLTPEFIKMNPQHTVPTMDDNGYILFESRAIMQYLSNQYGKDDSLYPKEPKQRGLVDQKLFFDVNTLYARFADYYYPVIMTGATADPEKLKKIEEAFEILDKFLENSNFIAGQNLTIADLSIVTSVSMFEAMKFDIASYKNVSKWFAKIKAVTPGYEEINGKNVAAFKAWVDSATKK